MMPRGGARVGAGGVNGHTKRRANLLPMPGTAPAQARPVPEPPADMLEADRKAPKVAGLQKQSDVWREYAPAATANGTLTDATQAGFRYLCEITVRYRALALVIDTEGWQVDSELMGKKKHPLWTELRGFALRRETALRSYGLLGNGKAVAAAPAQVADPWQERERRRKA